MSLFVKVKVHVTGEKHFSQRDRGTGNSRAFRCPDVLAIFQFCTRICLHVTIDKI